jgi:hypothetical protein
MGGRNLKERKEEKEEGRKKRGGREEGRKGGRRKEGREGEREEERVICLKLNPDSQLSCFKAPSQSLCSQDNTQTHSRQAMC